MKAKERDKRMEELFKADMEILKAKGHDYSGDDDALLNFKDFGFMGIVVRIGDKFSRLRSFVKSGLTKVKDESVDDTLRDMAMYSYLGRIVREEEKRLLTGPEGQVGPAGIQFSIPVCPKCFGEVTTDDYYCSKCGIHVEPIWAGK